MNWILDYAPEFTLAIGLAFGFAAGLAYAHGSERREHRRIIRGIKSGKAILPRGRK